MLITKVQKMTVFVELFKLLMEFQCIPVKEISFAGYKKCRGHLVHYFRMIRIHILHEGIIGKLSPKELICHQFPKKIILSSIVHATYKSHGLKPESAWFVTNGILQLFGSLHGSNISSKESSRTLSQKKYTIEIHIVFEKLSPYIIKAGTNIIKLPTYISTGNQTVIGDDHQVSPPCNSGTKSSCGSSITHNKHSTMNDNYNRKLFVTYIYRFDPVHSKRNTGTINIRIIKAAFYPLRINWRSHFFKLISLLGHPGLKFFNCDPDSGFSHRIRKVAGSVNIVH